MQTKPLILALLAGLAVSGAAQAALHDRGGGLIYDTVLNITWLQNANLAASNTFGLAYNTDLGDHPDDSWAVNYTEQILADGRMTWGAALHWIDAMNADNYLGYDDWRLPTPLNTDGSGPTDGYYRSGSEMGHLFYVDGGLVPIQDISESTSLDDFFINMKPAIYWYGLEYAPDSRYAWVLRTNNGYQDGYGKSDPNYAWAVRPGDVAAPIPEPETYALLLAGLGLVSFLVSRRKQEANMA
jgi:hypothetical protein